MNILQGIYKTVCCVPRPKFKDPYNFSFKAGLNYPQNQLEFSDNYIKTAKYTIYNFLFKAILLQYTRVANVYFLIIGILSSFPQITPVNSATIWFPIIIVLSLSVIRQGYQDYQRHKSDEQLNYQYKSLILKQDSFRQIQWSSIKVGDVIKVLQQQFIPADLILIASADPTGNAFIQTSSLDGQKNLKVRKAYNQTNKYNCEQLVKNLQGQWKGSLPDKDLHRFSSKMFIQGQWISIQGQKQFLYRGARLKNTHWVYGLVIYTGINTKIMMNLDQPKSKMSQIEVKVNYLLAYIMLFQICLCIFGSVASTIFRSNHQNQYYYIQWSSKSLSDDGFIMFFSYFILMSTFIPISLVVSLQFVKVFQSYFINNDKLMYNQQRKKGVTAKTVGLNQQLGQIQYVFTDKTGTLTKNLMQFKIAIVGQIQFGQITTNLKAFRKQSKQLTLQQDIVSKQIKEDLIKRKSQKLYQEMVVWDKQFQKKLVLKNFYDLANQYLKILSIAHEVLPQHLQDNSIVYRGASPDQICLVDFAKKCGYQFIDSNQSTTTLKISNQIVTYEVLQVFPFSPERKRMSIVIKENGLIKMFVKGADNVIKQRLAQKQSFNLDQKVDQLASSGLRTLLIAMKILSQSQIKEFKQAVDKLQIEGKDQAYDRLVSDLQTQLYLIGATAVLDRLQDQIPQTIRDLLSANIKVWMLTGDKLQTAQNIGKSCHLIHKDFKILKIGQEQQKNIDEILSQYAAKVQEYTGMKIGKALIIQGMMLTLIISNEKREQIFLSILQQCEAIICCRLLPLQKAEIVRLVKNKLKKVCLAIGDGQNDIPMIRAANIGIGLFGQEGMGAVQASDYALPQFRMLRRLLFVHGRWNYLRISEMILYFFYKNIIFTAPRLIFGVYSGFSAQRVFDDLYVGLYNILFTSIPLVVRAVFQQDLNYVFKKPMYETNNVIYTQIQQQTKSHVLTIAESKYLPEQYYINKYYYKLFPKIYFVGQQNCIFNYRNFIFWVIQAIVLGTILTLIAFQVVPKISINERGYNSDIWITSLALFTGLMMVVTLKLITHTKSWPVILIISILFFSLGFYVGYMWISNSIVFLTDNMIGAPKMAWSSGLIYFFVVFCCCLILILDGISITMDFHYGQYASKMRRAVAEQQETNRKYLQQCLSLRVTQTDLNYMRLN